MTRKFNNDAARIIRQEYGASTNMITPYVIEIDVLAFAAQNNGTKVVYELSYGNGLDQGTTLYGLTVVTERNGVTQRLRSDDLLYGGCFSSEAQARARITEIRSSLSINELEDA